MKFKTDDDAHSFDISPEGAGLEGIYDGDSTQKSSLEFTNTLPTSDGKFSKVPKGWIAQDGYMTTNPKQQGLGYMMSFAGATMAAQGGIENVFVSSGSVGAADRPLLPHWVVQNTTFPSPCRTARLKSLAVMRSRSPACWKNPHRDGRQKAG